MVTALIFPAVGFLSYANGAHADFKAVASLFGGCTSGLREASSWPTSTTVAGSVAAIFLAQDLLNTLSGNELVPDTLLALLQFVLAVAIGVGATALFAAVLGFPNSTRQGLMRAQPCPAPLAAAAYTLLHHMSAL